jgi:hypothetical protein
MELEYNSHTRYMSEDNQMLLDDLFADWSLEDCVESDLDEQFFRDFHSSQTCLCQADNMTTRELGQELRPLLRFRTTGDEVW